MAYQPLIEAANKAAAAINAAGLRGSRATVAAARTGADQAGKQYDRQAKAAERAAAAESRAAERAQRAKEKAIKALDRIRERDNDKIVREGAQIEAAEEAAARRAEARAKRVAATKARANERAMAAEERGYGRAAKAAFGTARRAVGVGLGAMRTVAGGMGVDLDVGSLINKGVSLESSAVALSNSSYFAGKAGPAGQRQDPKAIIAEVQKVAMDTGNESGDIMEGLRAFVAKTGDLQSGRDALADLSKLAKATGTNMQDMVDAAGDVANALGDVPNKGEAIKSVMNTIAAQGKEGAVEIRDLATQMAKLGAASTQFGGSSVEAMANMGALVQLTRAKGGAASSTQAATSVGAFVNTFSKAARREGFKKYGVAVEDAQGKLRNPRDIIVDALRATKGSETKLQAMFADVTAKKVTRGFTTIYKEAGGGEAGIAAVTKAFDDLARATMLRQEVEESFARSMQTSESKAKQFNEQLGKAATEMQSALLPAVQALVPAMVKATSWAMGLVNKYDIFGFQKKKQDSEDIGIEARAINAAGAVRDGLAEGHIVEGETEQAAKARDELRAAVDRKRAEVSQMGRFMYGGLDFGKRLDTMTPDELIAATKKGASWGRGGDDEAKSYLESKQQLERMEDTLGKLDNGLYKAMQRALEGSIVTVRLDDPTYVPPPSITTPTAGREAAPGHR